MYVRSTAWTVFLLAGCLTASAQDDAQQAEQQSVPIEVRRETVTLNDDGQTMEQEVLTISLPSGPVHILIDEEDEIDVATIRTCGSAKAAILATWDEVLFTSCNHPTRGDAQVVATGYLADLLTRYPACIADARVVTVKLREFRYLGAAVCKYP